MTHGVPELIAEERDLLTRYPSTPVARIPPRRGRRRPW